MHAFHFEYWVDATNYKGYVAEYPDFQAEGVDKEEVRQKLFDIVWKQKRLTSRKVWTGWIVKEGWRREAFWIREGWGGISTEGESY